LQASSQVRAEARRRAAISFPPEVYKVLEGIAKEKQGLIGVGWARGGATVPRAEVAAVQGAGVERMPTFYEFLAGGGLARAGLGDGWERLFANDIDPKKGASYEANWGRERLNIEDVGKLTTADLPGRADLAWASFPCQDLSLAGDYAGLKGERSGTFWPFWRLMEALVEEGRAPAMVVLENVCGALTSHGAKDFAAIGDALADGGLSFRRAGDGCGAICAAVPAPIIRRGDPQGKSSPRKPRIA